jgi:hypothetical protein
MKRVGVLRVLTTLVVVSVVTTGMVAPSAMASSQPERLTDAEFLAIVDQAWRTGSVSAAQRESVLTRPDLAATTIDPTSVKADYELPGYVPDPTEVKTPPHPPKASGAHILAASTVTTSRDRYLVYDNWVGTVYARYHFVVSWSYNGTSVVGTPSSYTYIQDCGGSCTNNGITWNGQYPNYSGGRLYAWTVPLKARWRYCKAGLCEPDYTPSVRFGVYYNGTYNYVVLNK